jgi:hypothetical protein
VESSRAPTAHPHACSSFILTPPRPSEFARHAMCVSPRLSSSLPLCSHSLYTWTFGRGIFDWRIVSGRFAGGSFARSPVPLLRVCLRFADLGAAAVPCRRRPRHAMRRTSARPSAMRWSGMQQRRDPEGFSKQKSAVEGKSVRKARRSIIGNLGHVVTKRASTLVGSTLGISVGELRSMREHSWRCSRLWRSGLQRVWCGRECGGELRFSRVR